MAEGIMQDLISKNNLDWKVDSAGTEYYHVGEMPDARAIRVCKKNGIDITPQHARRIAEKDFEEFDRIYALADEVIYEIERIFPLSRKNVKLRLLMNEVFPGENRSVPDPWYGNNEDFEKAFSMIRQACEAIVKNNKQ